MSTFGFFVDAGLTVPLSSLRHYSTQTGDWLCYYGSPATGKILQDAANPGTGQVRVTIDDSAPGSGLPATAIKLASTSGGLSTATPGAALNLGTLVTSGVANARPVHLRIDTSAGTVPLEYLDLAFEAADVIESDA